MITSRTQTLHCASLFEKDFLRINCGALLDTVANQKQQHSVSHIKCMESCKHRWDLKKKKSSPTANG